MCFAVLYSAVQYCAVSVLCCPVLCPAVLSCTGLARTHAIKGSIEEMELACRNGQECMLPSLLCVSSDPKLQTAYTVLLQPRRGEVFDTLSGMALPSHTMNPLKLPKKS